jgi:hypothetical protein
VNPTRSILRRRPAIRGAVPVAVLVLAVAPALAPAAGAVTYYVSSSSGNDGNSGTSSGSPFRTLGKVNTLSLQAGDQVRLFCGDVWRAERLIIAKSGTAALPITVTSQPLACPDRPVISGAQPIVGWVLDTGNVYRANLLGAGNNGRFPGGINQLFRNGQRLPHGRWPNLNAANGGYSTIDTHNGTTITDADLPLAPIWTGAYFQHRAAYWYLKRRKVTGDSGTMLTLEEAPICDRPTCANFGYFLNHHRATLDQDGEWFFDESTNVVYVVSNAGMPPPDNAIEGSVVGSSADIDDQSGVILGGVIVPLDDDVDWVVIDNLEVRDWAGNGIQMAELLRDDEDKNITIRNNLVVDVARIGIRLTTNVFDADVGPVNSIRGGQNGLVQDNVIDGAILAGIEMHSVDTVVERNTIRNIGLLAELTADGLGCALTLNNCAIHGNGIRLAVDDQFWSGNGNTLRLNRLEQIGWTGIDVRGPFNLIEHNVIVEPSVTLAEGAGIRTYDGNVFNNSRAHDITVRENVVLDPVGEYHGMDPARSRFWGYGINIDYSDAVEVTGNTVAGATAYGLIFTFARGTATGNTLWDNTNGPSGVAHVRVLDTNPAGGTSRVAFHGNAIYARLANRPLLSIETLAHITAADNNYYFNPFDNRLVRVSAISPIAMTLSSWQATSGRDGSSSASWFSLFGGQPDPSVLFVNDTDTTVNIPLAEDYFALDQSVVTGSLNLAPFSSRILIGGASVIFADGFESGDTASWSAVVP